MFRLIFLTIVVVVISGVLFTIYTRPAVLPPQLQSLGPTVRSSVDTGINGLRVALTRSKDAQPAVMGVKTESSKIFQEDTAGKPIHQKAMEFTQYQYCKMVVNGYEAEQAKSSSPPVTVTPKPSDIDPSSTPDKDE